MGAVYEATHLKLGRRFALKVRLPERDDPEAIRRFEQEARLAGSLESRHVVPVVDFDQTADGLAFLVMEYVDGEDLRRLLEREGALSLRRTVNLLSQAGAGIAAAHERSVIHRDLKPSNLMVSRGRDGQELCQVTDFGVARRHDEDHRASGSAATRTGALVGTLSYMSPEQVRGEKVDQRSDVYSLGAILYECLTERRPFDAAAAHTLIYRILHERPVPLRTLRPDLPSSVEAVVERALSPEREARFDHVDELVAALRATVESSPSGADAVTINERTGALRPRRSRPLRRALALVSVAAALGALATLVVVRRSEPEPAPAASVAAARESAAAVTPSAPAALRPEVRAESDHASATRAAEPVLGERAAPARARDGAAGAAVSGRTAGAREVLPLPPSRPAGVARQAPPSLNPDAAVDPFAQ
jgi:serine/threonine-protein kinase